MSKKQLRYRVGIDVGLYSVGLAAIEIDDSDDNPYNAIPIDFLSIMTVVHDGAIDPIQAQYAHSRKLSSGAARRTRRLYKRRRKRLQILDNLLSDLDYPVNQAISLSSGFESIDPYLPWRARIELMQGYIEDDKQRSLMLAIAMRHIARHRGWRNPYSSIETLKDQSLKPSAFYDTFFEKIQIWNFDNSSESLYPDIKLVETLKGNLVLESLPKWNTENEYEIRPTIAQLIEPLLAPDSNKRFRKSIPKDKQDSVFAHIGKLHQSDNYYELVQLFNKQRVSEKVQKQLFNAIFTQVNPKDVGAAAKLVAKDGLQPNRRRASKASIAFQKYRILTTIANLRIKEGQGTRNLLDKERRLLYDYLSSEDASQVGPELTWHDVAEQLGLERSDLLGVGGQTADGEPISAKQPPYLSTEYAILFASNAKKLPELIKKWWVVADSLSKEYFIEFLGNAGMQNQNLDVNDQRAKENVDDLLAELGELDETSLSKLDDIELVAGRASYSVNTLERLNKRMLEDGLDLFDARKLEFGVENDWKPAPEPLGTQTGNPAVDRTIKIVARWLKACEAKWGKPELINIEHVRDGFKTQKKVNEEQMGMNKRFQSNNKVRTEIVHALNEDIGTQSIGFDAIKKADIRRWQSIQRQNNQCLYCGATIDFYTAQMDHIVPRKGSGSSNVLPNLVAVCADCNVNKSNKLFYSWATKEQLKETLERVTHWNRDSYFSSDKEFASFKKDVKSRLLQKEEDEALDVRSIESVAWMARELRTQIEGYFGYGRVVSLSTEGNYDRAFQRVQVYKGWITSEARRASGLEKSLPWIGSYSEKTRLDRRHHAVDAAVIAMMRPSVAKTLLVRDSLRQEFRNTRNGADKKQLIDWKGYKGSTFAERSLYQNWLNNQMKRLQIILHDAMRENRVIVTNYVRLQIGIGRAHKDEIKPLYKKRVGEAMSVAAIDKAESPALWLALTGHKDYNDENGLSENWAREIRVHDRWLTSQDEIGFMAKDANELDSKDVNAVYTNVRGGYAGIGDAIHHARFYRIPKYTKGKQSGWQYASLRVFQEDLLKYRTQNVFSVPLPPESISVRNAIPSLRSSLKDLSAEYIGWAVVGDELAINPSAKLFSPEGSGKINKFMKAFPNTTQFKISGFDTNSRMTLIPLFLSAEGLPLTDWGDGAQRASQKSQEEILKTYGPGEWLKNDIDQIKSVIKDGCPLSVDKVFSTLPTIVRRNTLGYKRWKSKNNMPVSWKVFPHPITW